jgi:hypothetical protein
MPDAPDYKMFLKLLNLTTSQYDGEALNAIRMANAVLARTNQSWEDLLDGKIVMIAPLDNEKPLAKSQVRYSNHAEIDGFFEILYDRGDYRLGTFKAWVDSVHEWWEEKGYLTEKQYETLKKSARR